MFEPLCGECVLFPCVISRSRFALASQASNPHPRLHPLLPSLIRPMLRKKFKPFYCSSAIRVTAT